MSCISEEWDGIGRVVMGEQVCDYNCQKTETHGPRSLHNQDRHWRQFDSHTDTLQALL